MRNGFINESTTDLLQVKVIGDFQERFANANEQMPIRRHALRKSPDRTTDGVMRKIDENITAEDDMRGRQSLDFRRHDEIGALKAHADEEPRRNQ